MGARGFVGDDRLLVATHADKDIPGGLPDLMS